jgi:hypothetical protein
VLQAVKRVDGEDARGATAAINQARCHVCNSAEAGEGDMQFILCDYDLAHAKDTCGVHLGCACDIDEVPEGDYKCLLVGLEAPPPPPHTHTSTSMGAHTLCCSVKKSRLLVGNTQWSASSTSGQPHAHSTRTVAPAAVVLQAADAQEAAG